MGMFDQIDNKTEAHVAESIRLVAATTKRFLPALMLGWAAAGIGLGIGFLLWGIGQL